MSKSREKPDDLDESEVPDGAAVFPEIPAELGVDPLFLAVVHSTIFLSGSSPEVVNPDAGDEALAQITAYLQRIEGERLRRVREDVMCLVGFAKQEKWPKALIEALKTLMDIIENKDAPPDEEDD